MADILSPIPFECLARSRAYLLEDPTVERGALITTSWELVPFRNVATNPVARIEMGKEDFGPFADLVFAKRLFGWVHSHPYWAAYPSPTDLEFHRVPIHMVIYSIPEDGFRIYTAAEIANLSLAETGYPALEEVGMAAQDWKKKAATVLATKLLFKVKETENGPHYCHRAHTGKAALADAKR